MLMNFLHIYRQQFISLIDYHKLKNCCKTQRHTQYRDGIIQPSCIMYRSHVLQQFLFYENISLPRSDIAFPAKICSFSASLNSMALMRLM